MYCRRPHHVDQLRDLEAKAYSDRVVGVLDGSDPALVTLEQVPEQRILHLCQGHKLTRGWERGERGMEGEM